MIFEDRIQVNPRLLRLLDPRTNEIVDFEIQDLDPTEILQEGTEVNAEYLNELLTYSTEEKVVGTWIDGKPLYRKTVNFGALPNNTTKGITHNIQNLNEIIKLWGFARSSQSRGGITLPHATTTPISLYCDDTYIGVKAFLDASVYTEAYINIEYTKTTD